MPKASMQSCLELKNSLKKFQKDYFFLTSFHLMLSLYPAFELPPGDFIVLSGEFLQCLVDTVEVCLEMGGV